MTNRVNKLAPKRVGAYKVKMMKVNRVNLWVNLDG